MNGAHRICGAGFGLESMVDPTMRIVVVAHVVVCRLLFAGCVRTMHVLCVPVVSGGMCTPLVQVADGSTLCGW